MAKDGTIRGGNRAGSGRKPKKSNKKLEKNTLKIDELEGVDMPPIQEYLTAKQKNGKNLVASEVFKNTFLWLKKLGIENLVSVNLIEQYAMSVARWIQCEEAISEYGFLAKHPTTGNAMQSPYVAMSQNYMKQVNQVWFQIYQIVKDNAQDYSGANPQDDLMERLLTARRK